MNGIDEEPGRGDEQPDPEHAQRQPERAVALAEEQRQAGPGQRPAEPDGAELDLARACGEEGVDFLSMRNSMLAEHEQNGLLCRGFHNSAPGMGHFNEVGHRALGTAIWEWASTMPAGR